MLALPLLFLILFGLFAYIRGALFFVKTKKQPMNAEQEVHSINRILLSSFVLAAAISIALLAPLFLNLMDLFMHSHTMGGDLLHTVLSRFSTTFALSVGLPLLSAFLLWAWGPLFVRWYRVQRWIRLFLAMKLSPTLTPEMKASIAENFHGDVLWVPGAWSGLVGVFRPTLLLGVELISTLDESEFKALLSHEEAHRQRRDPLCRMLLLLSSRLLPVLGGFLFTRWVERTEELCDQFAAHSIKDPLTVATALIQTQRLQLHFLAVLREDCPAFTSFAHPACVETRVHHLMALEQIPKVPSTPKLCHLFTLKLALSLLLLQYPLHHFLEYILSLLVR